MTRREWVVLSVKAVVVSLATWAVLSLWLAGVPS